MGAAASLVGESAAEFENFKKIRDEYEAKVAAGATDTELYDHISAVMSTLGAKTLTLELLTATNESNNCSEEIVERANLNLLATEGSKVNDMKAKVSAAIVSTAESKSWPTVTVVDTPCAVVTCSDNFDSLKVPTGHYSRLPSDVYYCDKELMLRTQLTAHLKATVTSGTHTYSISGDTFRRIEEDEVQSELQHKLEFVHIFDTPANDNESEEVEAEEYVAFAESVVKSLLSADAKTRWEESDEAFHVAGEAFNDLQTKAGEQILDLARAGRLTEEFLASLGFESGKSGFVVTFDLDHLAMVINAIPDIRQLHA